MLANSTARYCLTGSCFSQSRDGREDSQGAAHTVLSDGSCIVRGGFLFVVMFHQASVEGHAIIKPVGGHAIMHIIPACQRTIGERLCCGCEEEH